LPLLGCVILLLAAGCGTTVRITSDPPGLPAYVRGSGRAAYHWTFLGPTPAESREYYNAVLTKVVWPDGTASEEKRASLIGEDEVKVHFQRPQPGSVSGQTAR
jgi:hypothetical protein